jgi:hypothetical protein
MKQRQFVKIIGTSITGVGGGRLETQIGRGITHLKRDCTLLDFVTEFLHSRNITTFSLHERDDGSWATSPMMFLNIEPKQVLTFTFKQFEQDDIGFHAKDLSPTELKRDMKSISKLIYG